MTKTVAEVAAGLTKAQRAAMVALPGDRFTMWPAAIARVTIKRLIERGMLSRTPPRSGFGMAIHEWTDLGLSVRNHLLEGKKP